MSEHPIKAGDRHEGFPLLTDSISRVSVPLFVGNLLRGEKPRSEWLCGVEFELFGYDTARGLARIDAGQVQEVLAGFAPSSRDLVYEGGVLVEVNDGKMNRLTVEPGGQVEFSGGPQRRLADVEHGVRRYLARLHEIAESSRIAFIAAGFDPLRTIGEQRWFPKQRYEVMRPYLASRGERAWDMMTRTCAVQTNLDYGSPEDLRKKYLVGNRLAPVVTAIFANSPFEDGRLSRYKSARAAVWLRTDPDRTSISPPALEDDFTPEAFVAYALDAPMIFAQRHGLYLGAVSGMRFRDFLERGCPGIQPVFGDWADHLTTIFTDARLKQHIELRSADAGSPEMAMALQALWKGLLYDEAALDEALRIAPRLKLSDALALREAVARDGLAASSAGVNVLRLARECVALAYEGLGRIAPEEVPYLDALKQQVVVEGICPADILVRNWEGSWHGSVGKLVEYMRVA
jgi:glutamate--cysteine ligase